MPIVKAELWQAESRVDIACEDRWRCDGTSRACPKASAISRACLFGWPRRTDL